MKFIQLIDVDVFERGENLLQTSILNFAFDKAKRQVARQAEDKRKIGRSHYLHVAIV